MLRTKIGVGIVHDRQPDELYSYIGICPCRPIASSAQTTSSVHQEILNVCGTDTQFSIKKSYTHSRKDKTRSGQLMELVHRIPYANVSKLDLSFDPDMQLVYVNN